MSDHSTHSARLHALAAALCALLLLVALGVMDAHRAPWWALLATQSMLLVTTASAGIWLDRSVAFGVRRKAFGRGGDEAMRGPASGDDWMRAWAEKRTWSGAFRYTLPHRDGGEPRDDDDVFWQERLPGEGKEER